MSSQKPSNSNNKELLQYAGLGAQLLAALGIGVYIGHLVDTKWLKLSIPILTILLPVIILVGMMFSIWRATSKKTKDDTKK